jgi:hypothetical protein
MEELMENKTDKEIGVASELAILQVIDSVEEIIETHPHEAFAFGLAAPAEGDYAGNGVTRKLLFIGRTGMETLKVLSNLHKTFSPMKNFRHRGLTDLAQLSTQSAAVVLYLLSG